ncbi:MAG: DUF2207 domain-containing protein [Candidatus Pacebacteria bacterium]|nr:DUF2207 domain-containing protein [Candidatus Paceibacterota bacterium]MBP9780872.1 DUF2207 domain-containing protein [Candidatus Paceibacterota bacterium]
MHSYFTNHQQNIFRLFFIKIVIVFFALIALCGALNFAHAQNPADETGVLNSSEEMKGFEHIQSYDVQFVLDESGDVRVTETIEYEFEGTDRHGIFRTIPTGFKAGGQYKEVEFSIHDVTDTSGQSYMFDVTDNSAYLTIKIGDPDVVIEGVHTYILDYSIKNSVGFFENFDEVYFNMIGVDWDIPISNITATFVLPENTPINQESISFYCGAFGVNTSCGAFNMVNPNTLMFSTTELNPYEGITASFSFPLGVMVRPDREDYYMYLLRTYWPVVIPIFLAWFLLKEKIRAYVRLKKFNRTHPLIHEYSLPSDISPVQAKYLMNGFLGLKDVSSVVVDLAVRGYITIHQANGKYSFSLKEKDTSQLSQNETRLILHLTGEKVADIQENTIFDKIPDVIKSAMGQEELEELKNKMELNTKSQMGVLTYELATQTLGDYQNEIDQQFINPKKHTLFSKYKSFKNSRLEGLFQYIFLASFVFFFGMGFFGVKWALIVSAFVLLVSVSLSIIKILDYTDEGMQLRRKVEGLKYYIKVAEKDRINFANAPAQTPELFEKLLPYAMAFGLEKKWVSEFENIVLEPPAWLVSDTGSAFTMHSFATGLSGLSRSTSASIGATAPRSSSSSGSSGSSGGGSSGGGSGGGGGGSW